MKSHYNEVYYRYQKKSGDLGGMIDLWQFKDYIKESDNVLDFGCGGGQILENLRCRNKYGVEINPTAISEAIQRGVRVYKGLKEIPASEKFDVIISHHTLEHLDKPAEILKFLRNHLKQNGYAIHVVPINDWRKDKQYNPGDINKHLFTWTPLLLGNLFAKCGYKVKKVEILTHAWLPLSKYTYKILPHFLYHFFSKIWSLITYNRQIRIVATI